MAEWWRETFHPGRPRPLPGTDARPSRPFPRPFVSPGNLVSLADRRPDLGCGTRLAPRGMRPASLGSRGAGRMSHSGALQSYDSLRLPDSVGPAGQNALMAKMDTEWAIAEIDGFLSVTARVSPNNGGGIVFVGTVMRGPRTEASQRAHVVEQILDRALPGWSKNRPDQDRDYSWLRDRASRARAALEREAELAEKLGENAPDMDAANLHPWAWENGRSYWNSGHYHQTVMQAAIRINAETQAKIGRLDVSEVALFNEAFSLSEPKEDAPRLRLAQDDGSKTYENLHRGARAFADGLYTAIRNPGMHKPHESAGGEEQLALEQLAAFSLLARWVDQAAVEAT